MQQRRGGLLWGVPSTSAPGRHQSVQVWKQDFPGMSRAKLMGTVVRYWVVKSSWQNADCSIPSFVYIHVCMCINVLIYITILYIHMYLESRTHRDREATVWKRVFLWLYFCFIKYFKPVKHYSPFQMWWPVAGAELRMSLDGTAAGTQMPRGISGSRRCSVLLAKTLILLELFHLNYFFEERFSHLEDVRVRMFTGYVASRAGE